MIINDVPTNTPIPIVDTILNLAVERLSAKGSTPARKDAAAMTTHRLSKVNRPCAIFKLRCCYDFCYVVMFSHGATDFAKFAVLGMMWSSLITSKRKHACNFCRMPDPYR